MRRLLVLTIALALFAAACGGDDDVATGPDDTADDTPSGGGDDGAGGATDDGRSAGGGDDAAGTRPRDGEDTYAVGTLDVTVTHPDAETVTYTLSCFGDTASLTGEPAVDAEAACRALKEPRVQELLVEGPPQDRVCTEIYGGPDEARITGSLADRPVDVTITRVDGCAIDDWDTVLSDVLPEAIGVTG